MKIKEFDDPYMHFCEWFKDMEKLNLRNYNAMNIATIDKDGWPNNRIVLLKEYDERGYVFYTNLGSQKSHDLEAHPKVSACFYWEELRRQIRIKGNVTKVDDKQADQYFAGRPRGSQIGAWASKQSEVLKDRREFEGRVKEMEDKFANQTVARPDFWSGFRIEPHYYEFWQEEEFRCHQRLIYKKNQQNHWDKFLLYP